MKPPKYSIFLLLVISLAGCNMPLRSFFLGWPDDKDLTRSAYHEIKKGDDCFQFYRLPEGEYVEIKVNDWTTDVPVFKTIEGLAQDRKVRSLLVIRNDTLLKEYYGKGFSSDDLNPSYSLAKTFTSALVGVAIEEEKIKSEKELVVKYIPEIAIYPESEQLTIEHLLNHTSGIKYTFSSDARLYYGNNVFKEFKKLEFEARPGTKQYYLNVNIQLLGIVLHRATGVSPSKYMEEKLWKPIQMCNDGVWSTDKNDEEKAFCCMGATALDYAKFGRLFLNKGVWNGKQVISEEWYDKSIERDTTEGSSYNYNYCWHIGLKEYGDYMAIGMYKQHIYINPKKNLLIVVLNDKEKLLEAERVNWWNVFRQIADQL